MAQPTRNPLMDSYQEFDIGSLNWYHEEQRLITQLFSTLEIFLRNHCQETQSHHPDQTPPPATVEYHAIVALQPEQNNHPVVTWTCGTCFTIYRFAGNLNRRLDVVRRRQNTQDIPLSPNYHLIHPLHPPFPSIHPSIVLSSVQDHGARSESPPAEERRVVPFSFLNLPQTNGQSQTYPGQISQLSQQPSESIGDD